MFDTNVFIKYFAGDVRAKQIMDPVLTGTASGSVSAITTLEIWQFPRFDRKLELIYTSIRRAFDEVPVNHKIAATAGEAMRPYSPNRRRRMIRDALIVASAASRREPVYTFNRRDFQRLGAIVLNI